MTLHLTWPEVVAATAGRRLLRMGGSLRRKPGLPCVACPEADRFRKWHLYRNLSEVHERLRLARQDQHRCLGCRKMAKLTKGMDSAGNETTELLEPTPSSSFV
jgi:hypothetical protein